MDYVLLDNNTALLSQIEEWNAKNRIAVDFEGEFNLHIYGMHLCLIQIYDGERYFIIDPRAKDITKEALVAFFESPVKKVWFDMQSDNSLIHKNYESSLKNVTDVRVMAKCLGYMGNLTGLVEEYLGIKTEVEDKKKLQQTNWLRRPLNQEQIDYALSDVEYLFAIEDKLRPLILEKHLEKECDFQMKKAHIPAEEKPGWTKLCQWKLLNKEQKAAMKEYFIARDVVAKRFNVPSYMVLDKHRITELGKKCPATETDMFQIIGKIPPRFQAPLTESMKKAFERLHGGL